MDIRTAASWIIELNEVDSRIEKLAELSAHIDGAESLPQGSLSIYSDVGPRPLWQRMFGAKRIVVSYFSLEWYAEFASLIFHDDDWSEFRSLDQECPVAPPSDVRLKIAHGELKPHPQEECLMKSRAFEAVRAFIACGDRPSWLTYRFVR